MWTGVGSIFVQYNCLQHGREGSWYPVWCMWFTVPRQVQSLDVKYNRSLCIQWWTEMGQRSVFSIASLGTVKHQYLRGEKNCFNSGFSDADCDWWSQVWSGLRTPKMDFPAERKRTISEAGAHDKHPNNDNGVRNSTAVSPREWDWRLGLKKLSLTPA